MMFRKPVGRGVRAGLETVFAKGGPASLAFSKMLDEGLKPVRVEVARLRRIEARLPDLEAENARLRAQIADMQADHNETWGGKVAVSTEELTRLLDRSLDLEGVKEALRPLAESAEVGRSGSVGMPDSYDDYWTVSVPRIWLRRARAALQALEAKNV